MEQGVVCRRVSKVYRQNSIEVAALTDVDLAIAPGEFVCLSGPSGSGKTTLLNLLGGLDRPTSGEVLLDGLSLGRLRAGELARLRLARIGFVFQAYNLLPVLSARENVEFVLQLRGVPARERAARAREVLREVGLEGLENRRPAELSGGQQQRVAVARAIAARPALVLADEPTANLDSRAAESLMALLRRLNEAHGITFVFSTHDRRVMEFARRQVRLQDGRVVADERAG
ncbi:MAG TPA: ABC transporter ATP-binding protein [Thermodesulfobacteriota bacterium]|nr:ABC transporter ATP-binding protein [Thermodesulfobacteriota bacterium]